MKLKTVSLFFLVLLFALQASYITQLVSTVITPSTGTPVFVQAVEAHTAATPTSLAVSLGTLPVVGNVVMVGAITTVNIVDLDVDITDNQSNAYSRSVMFPNTTGLIQRVSLWCGPVATSAGTYTVTMTTTSNTGMQIFAAEYSGTSCNPDRPAGASTSTSPYNCGNITTRNANDLLLSILGTNGSTGTIAITPPTGFTTRVSQLVAASGVTGAFADQIVAATNTFTPTWTADQNVTNSRCAQAAIMSK